MKKTTWMICLLAVIALAVAVTNTETWEQWETRAHWKLCKASPTYERVMIWWGWK